MSLASRSKLERRSEPEGTFGLTIATLSFQCLLLWSLLSGCATTSTPRLERFQYTSPHMGTQFSITVYAETREHAEAATQAAFNRVAQLEDILSDYVADSELSQLGHAPVGEPVLVGEDLFHVLKRGGEISAMTDGAFDLTAGPFTRLWRFARKQKRLPSDSELAAARAAVGWRKLLLNTNAHTATLTVAGMRLDAGGIGKGFAANEAMRVLKTHGIDRALVAAGGDILTGLPPPGTEGWTVEIAGTGTVQSGPQVHGWVGSGIGIEGGAGTRYRDSSVGLGIVGEATPAAESRPPQLLSVRNAAISTSGDAEQFVEIDGVGYSHIVSPYTGLGLTNRIQVTVIAPDATTSDALATACCVLGPKGAIQLADSLEHVSVIVLVREKDQSRLLRSKGAP